MIFKKTTFILLISCYFGFNIHLSNATPLAKIIREGEGRIGYTGKIERSGIVDDYDWPKDYSFPKVIKGVTRLKDSYYPDKRGVDARIIATWEPKNFTSLTDCKEGEELTEFLFLVHGLEIGELVEGLKINSLPSKQKLAKHNLPEELKYDEDFQKICNSVEEENNECFYEFVKKRLEVKKPLKDELSKSLRSNFINYYPYFFHEKTLVSASVISHNLTATFGDSGFILESPAQNYVLTSLHDIHAPTDIDFYRGSVSQSDGQQLLKEKLKKSPFYTLEELMPGKPVEIHGAFKKEEIESGRKQTLQSWYNEVNISPMRIYKHSNREFSRSCIYISGIFLRASKNGLDTFKEQPHVKKLWGIAENFDLPIVHIYDGNKYSTSFGES